LQAYPWPGNVRELENALQRAAVLAADGVVQPQHLPPRIQRSATLPDTSSARVPISDAPSATFSAPGTLPIMTLAELEKRAILEALERCEGNVSEVGRQLGIG